MPGIQIIGGSSGVVADSESAFKSIRVTNYPKDPGALGAYSMASQSGLMAAGLAANSEIFQWRWEHASNLCVPRTVYFSANQATVPFALGQVNFEMRIARSWTANGANGIALNGTGNDYKKRTSFGNTLTSGLTGIRMSTTSTLGAGTKTLDGGAIAAVVATSNLTALASAAIGGQLVPPGTRLWERNTADEYPLVFAQNEGFVIRAAVPATGVWAFSVGVEWQELTSF
jgi:hypothetical protein